MVLTRLKACFSDDLALHSLLIYRQVLDTPYQYIE